MKLNISMKLHLASGWFHWAFLKMQFDSKYHIPRYKLQKRHGHHFSYTYLNTNIRHVLWI